MDKIKLIAYKKIFEYLNSLSSNTLKIVDNKSNEQSESKKIKIVKLEERISSKKFDFIYLDKIPEISKSELKKLEKYTSKYNKFFIDCNNVLNNNENIIYLNISNSSITKHLTTYVNLTKKHKEFTKSTDEFIKFIESNIFKLGIFELTDRKHADITLAFIDTSIKADFLNYLKSSIDQTTLSKFYDLTLSTYAKGIDNRNARTQKIITDFSDQTKSVLGNLLKAGKEIQQNINTQREKAKEEEEVKQVVEIATKKVATKSQSSKYFENKLHSFEINLYKRRFVPQIKPISYDEFLLKQKPVFIQSMKDRRSLQRMKLQPKCSLIMVVNDIDEIWLNKSVRSIKEQTYKKWELIIVDNSSSRTYLKSYLYSLNDPRIKTYFYNSKRTYAECLMEGYKLSTGEFISIMEEGDEIEVESFFRFMLEVNKEPNVEYLYSDEDEINEQGKRVHPFFKGGWDTTMILSFPYTKHMLCAKREVIERVDPFKNYTSRDPIWDMILKISTATDKIVHLPQILYHKRIRPLQRSPYGLYFPDALKNYMLRETIQGSIKETSYKGAYYILKKDISSRKVSIFIDNLYNQNLDSVIQNLRFNHKNYDFHININRPIQIKSSENVHLYNIKDKPFSSVANTIIPSIDSDYVLTLNSRIRIDNPDIFTFLLSAVKEESIVGTLITDPDDIIQYSFYVKNLYDTLSNIYAGNVYKSQYDISVVRECIALSAKCMLIPRALLERVKFDENLTEDLYDIDFCFQAQEVGQKIIYTPIPAIHSAYAYKKERFNDNDNAAFIHKWKSALTSDDPHINTRDFLTVR